LLADDSVTAQNMGRKILADAGYEVITVNNGSAALKKIAELKPDLVVLDVYMPGYSGLEVCQRVKDSPDTSRIPVLLTVGKLEPFKPEEARRVRAEGFIVKPFEASELLSAISKLEDKIVPRGEAAKSGRFARAIAAVEENSRFDKNAGGDEDSGWKNRIAFPVKKEKVEEADGNDPEIYNAMNKDLRTVVDPDPAPVAVKLPETKAEDRVDMSALAPAGLPSDVSAEEIAALAAAAAQVKSKSAEAATGTAAPYTGPERRAEKIREQQEEKEKTKTETLSEVVAAAASNAAASGLPAAEKVEAAGEKTAEDTKAAPAVPAPSAAAVMEAIASLEPAHAAEPAAHAIELQSAALSHTASQVHDSQHVADSERAKEELEEVPVTMAVGAALSGSGEQARWMAIPVAIGADEAAISLHDEMQKAQVALVPAESAPAEAAIAEAAVATAAQVEVAAHAKIEPEPVAAAEPLPSEPSLLHTSQSPEPEAQPRSVVKAFETVSAGQTPLQDKTEPSAAPEVQSAAPSVEQPENGIEPVAAIAESVSPALAVAEAKNEDRRNEDHRNEDRPNENHKDPEPATTVAQELRDLAQDVPEKRIDAVVAEVVANQTQQVSQSVDDEKIASQPTAQEVSAPERSNVVSAVAEEELHAPPAEVAAARTEPTQGGEMAKKESEIAATTAAAWASWRQIRETGDPRGKGPESANASQPEVDEDEDDQPREAAAMAVAAGAENRPKDATEEAEPDPDAIASIVDSVLAQMRPKIVEEISRKMGKKK
jgi:CheY-like chemotaxis protein